MTGQFLNADFSQRELTWGHIVTRLLRRVGADDLYFEQSCIAAVPGAAKEYLVPWNPRLHDLQRAYSAYVDSALHSVWNPQFVHNDVPLDHFRGDCAYLWQKRNLNTPAAFVLTALYMMTQGKGRMLEALGEDDLFGCYTIPLGDLVISRDLLDSVNELSFLEQHLGLDLATVLDIGSGYGRFAHRLCQHNPTAKVYCCDAIPESSFLCEYYLDFRGVGTSAYTIAFPDVTAVLESITFQVAVNIHSFSECTGTAVSWWLTQLAANGVPFLFIVPNADQHGGRRLLTTERDGRRLDMLKICADHGYRPLIAAPKYEEAQIQRFGVSPTWYHLLRLT